MYYKADEQKTEQNQINVLYAANGGQFVDGNETMQGVADADGKLRQPPTPTRDGYTFAGWYWVSDLSDLTDEQKAEKKALAEELVEKLNSYTGDDIVSYYAELADEYSEDPGRESYPTGYTFTTGSMEHK